MNMKKRSTFGSRFGAIAVVGGSVVGLGNIWKFPYVAGENGGGAFILIYIVICFLIAMPVMMSEFAIGRSTASNPLGAVKKLTPRRGWRGIGYLSIIAAFMILPFYCVISGWTIEFLKDSVLDRFTGADAAAVAGRFNAFVATGWQPALWTIMFLAACCAIVGMGIEKGIERYSKVLMPALLLLLVGLSAYSATLGGFSESVEFLFRPDFSKIDGSVMIKALGQAFFSMSIGMGAMITYGSYIKREENFYKVAGTVVVGDVFVALLAGLAIFPAVFSFGISPTSGPDLVFLTLPTLFGQMTGGYVVSIFFFVLLLFAAMTSVFSLLEVLVCYFSEEFRLSRWAATGITFAAIAFMAVLCTLSQMPDGFTIGGKTLFDILDLTSSNYILPIGGLAIVVFAGWVMDKTVLRDQFTGEGKYGLGIYPALRFMIRFIIPVAIALMFLNLIGFLA